MAVTYGRQNKLIPLVTNCLWPGARNECEGGAMKNAKEKARGLVRLLGFRSRRSGPAF
jgi:hypothetical protein